MKWWIYIAIKQLFPSGKFASLFAIVSVLGVGVGVLALFGTQSVMNGFHSEIAAKLKDTGGQIKIEANGKILGANADEIVKALKANPEVEAVEKTACGSVMLMSGSTPAYPLLRSYDTISKDCAIALKDKGYVRMGSLEDLDDDSIIVGIHLANSLGISVGETVEIYAPTMLDKLSKDEIPLPVKMKVVGLLHSGFSDMDKTVCIVSLRRMQDLYSLGRGYHSITIKLKKGADEKAFAKYLNADVLRYPLRAYTWLTGNAQFMRVVMTEKVMMSVIIMLIIIVASFSICSSLYTTVLRKTKEIGLAAAMGARPRQIAACYCLQGFIIGACGAALGIMLTFLILHFRAPIVEFVIGKEALADFYHFSNLPVKYDFYDGARACLFAVILCTLAGLLPALR
ncbi:MAG: ABC transporter permease, partial [Opitutales bacterium]|nr:ABC transporter permease [Opitutales bacterium]